MTYETLLEINLTFLIDLSRSYFITLQFCRKINEWMAKDWNFNQPLESKLENPDKLQHYFDFIYSVQTDDNPTQALARFRQNEITKEEMLEL